MTRRQLLQTAAGVPALLMMGAEPPAYTIEIAPCRLELSDRFKIETAAYNGQVPGPLLRLPQGKPVTIDVVNRTDVPEVVHWHGLFIPSNVDGSMEEGTPMIAPGTRARYTFTPEPAGFRWYHTHTFAGHDLKKGQYTGQHGFLYIEPKEDPGRYDAEFFLALHDWRAQLLTSDDGSMNPFYDVSTINGHALGRGEPLRVKANQRVLFHIVNSSATDVHWLSFPGHQFEVIALDGNAVPAPKQVPMLRLAPAERVSAVVSMTNPGVWTLGEVRKHIRAAGMGVVVEYANQTGEPQWTQPEALAWNYDQFSRPAQPTAGAVEIPLVFKSKFKGHGDMDQWTINGKSFPDTDIISLRQGQTYRLLMKNESTEPHPVHLHRHVFRAHGLLKDTVLIEPKSETAVEFIANNPGMTLFHCHQQNHMDMGFMMLFRYA